MKKSKIVILALFLLSGLQVSEAQVLSRDSLSSEFKYFIKLIEKTHPDPYSEFGGKVQFSKEAFYLRQKIELNDYTLDQYRNILASFISRLHDGHSYISNNQISNINKYIPISFKVTTEGLILKGLPESKAKLLGSKVILMDGIPLDTLCKRISNISPSENRYGEYKNLGYMLFKPSILKQMFPDIEDKGYIEIKVETPNNTIENITLNLTENSEWYLTNSTQLPIQSRFSKDEYLYYTFANDKNTMYLRMKSVMAKENFLEIKQQKWPSLENQLKNFYQWTLRRKMPDNINEAIEGLPCFSDVFRSMLTEMKENNTSNLIVDLRGNGGGWTPITLPTLYMLYGDKYLNKDMRIYSYQMLSSLLMHKKATTLEEFNKRNKSNYEYGDYTFSESIINNNETQEEKRIKFVNRSLGESQNYIKDLEGNAIYTPENIYVITDEGTFSAAFHYAFYLWKMGAKVVGIPSSQSPNAYMEVTEFELPYTKLKGSISNSVQYFLPVNDKRAKIFWPDMMPEYKDYKKYNFDQDAELLWLLDYIKVNVR